jgi:hypothetical protein
MTVREQRGEPLVWLVGAAAGALALSALGGLAPDPYRPIAHQPLLASFFVAATVLMARFPVHLTFKTKVYLDSGVLTAAAILFDVRWAVAIGAISVALNEALLHDSWEQALFNTSQTALYVGTGGIVFHLLVRLPMPLALPGIGNAVAVAGCATTMYLLNTLLVAAIGARQVGVSPWQHWRDTVWLGIPEHAVLVLLAGIFAAVARESPWVLPILAVPSAVAYVSLMRSVQAQVLASEALNALAMVCDLRHPTRAGHSGRVAAHAHQLAIHLGLSPMETADVVAAARLHDVGKVLVGSGPSAHPASNDLVEPRGDHYPIAGADLVGSLSTFGLAGRYIRHHREHWDGSGFPDSIAGEAIPLGARIVGVADAYDALSAGASEPTVDRDAALHELKRGLGRRWDPLVVEALFELIHEGPETAAS